MHVSIANCTAQLIWITVDLVWLCSCSTDCLVTSVILHLHTHRHGLKDEMWKALKGKNALFSIPLHLWHTNNLFPVDSPLHETIASVTLGDNLSGPAVTGTTCSVSAVIFDQLERFCDKHWLHPRGQSLYTAAIVGGNVCIDVLYLPRALSHSHADRETHKACTWWDKLLRQLE